MLITIITINYNNLEGLKKTMKSVLEQTYGNIEYIVIDGGSTDGSKEYIDEHSQSLAYWVSEPDKGIYNAMNKGIDQATGEYLLFLNSGDELIDKEVMRGVESNNLKADIVACDIRIIGSNRDFIKKPPNNVTFSFLYKDGLPHPTTFIKRSLFNILGYYDEDLKIVSDWKFFLLALCKFNATYKHIDKVLSIFYLNGISSHPDNLEKQKFERKEVLNREFDVYLNDLEKLFRLNTTVNKLRKSKWINILIKLKLIKKF